MTQCLDCGGQNTMSEWVFPHLCLRSVLDVGESGPELVGIPIAPGTLAPATSLSRRKLCCYRESAALLPRTAADLGVLCVRAGGTGGEAPDQSCGFAAQPYFRKLRKSERLPRALMQKCFQPTIAG